ncbi:MAG: AsmA family protein [Zoogloeaceae bacterium]|jgi:AsmA protein|nr:AsmA family protein [Zoogloeaceae bacterium]
MKRTKRAGLWAFFILLLLCGLVLALRTGFDSDLVRERLTTQVRQETGRELVVEGVLRLRLLPRLAVEAEGIRLSSVDGKTTFLSLARLTGAIKIMPLLQGQVRVNRIELRNLEVNAVRHADGSTNFDDLLAQKSEAAGVWEIDVEKAVLLDGSLRWQDEASGASWVVKDLYLRTGHLGKQARGTLEVEGKVENQERLRAGLRLETHYWINGGENFVQLDTPNLSFKGEAGEAPFKLKAALRKLRVRAGATPGLALEDFTAQGETLRAESERWLAEVKLGTLELSRTDGAVQGLSAEVKQMVDETARNQARLQLEALNGKSGNWQGSLVLSGTGTQAGTAGDFTVNLPFHLATEATPVLNISKLRATANLQPGTRLARALRLEAEGNVQAAWATAATQEAPKEIASGDLSLHADESRLALSWQLRALHPLEARVVATLDKLDLDRYLKPAPAGTTADTPSSTEIPKAEADEGFRLSGTVKVGELRYQGVTASGLTGELRWRDGKLEVSKPVPKKSRRPAVVSRKKRRKV